MEQFVPVRVIRGHKCDTSYTKKVYTYDGLYQVGDSHAHGFFIYVCICD